MWCTVQQAETESEPWRCICIGTSKLDALPDTSQPLSASLRPAAIKDANEAVRSATRVTKPRGKYAKFTPEQQAAIAEYASLHGNQAAIRHVSKQLREAAHAKLKNTKFYSKGNSVIYAKICTYQNFPLYGTFINKPADDKQLRLV